MSLKTRGILVLVIGTILGLTLSLGGNMLAQRDHAGSEQLTWEQTRLISEVMDRVRARGAPLWWTGRDGAVIVGLGARPVARGFGPVGGACWAQPRFGGTSAW